MAVQRNAAGMRVTNFDLFVQPTGETEYLRLPGIVSVGQSGGDTPTQTNNSINGPITSAGVENPVTLSLDARLTPASAYLGLRQAKANGTAVPVRLSLDAQETYRGAGSVAIAGTGNTQGQLTFSGTGSDGVQQFINDGQILVMSVLRVRDGNTDRDYIITDISQKANATDFTVTVRNIDGTKVTTAVAATSNWVVGNAGFIQNLSCLVTQVNQIGVQSDGLVSDTIEFQTQGTAGAVNFNATALSAVTI